METMRQRLPKFLTVLTLTVSTVFAASAGLGEPARAAAAESFPTADRPLDMAVSRSHSRVPSADEPRARAPRAAQQDPARIPATEPPAPIRVAVPGGVTGIEVPRGLGGNYLVRPGEQEAPKGAATYNVSVEVEDGLPVTTEEFADFVMETLNHEKSWAKDGAVTFGRTESGPDLRIILASPATVDAECAPLKTNSRWSCGRYGKAMINADRWVNGAEAFTEAGGDAETYRRYVINHEVGHLIGYQHVSCPAPGEPAPVMAQQSMALGGCVPNGWAHP